MKNKILVVAVHPDDETLGCGGTLLKHKEKKDEIHWLICTSIDNKHAYFEQREQEIKRVAEQYNFKSLTNLRLKTMKVERYDISLLIEKISTVINKVKPNIVFLPFKGDVYSDHRRIFEAAYTCTKSFRYPFVQKIYMMETLSETEFAPSTQENYFVPNVFSDITKHIEKKIEILEIYKNEIGNHPFPRSERNIRALATFRGATSGHEYAESFMLLKQIS